MPNALWVLTYLLIVPNLLLIDCQDLTFLEQLLHLRSLPASLTANCKACWNNFSGTCYNLCLQTTKPVMTMVGCNLANSSWQALWSAGKDCSKGWKSYSISPCQLLGNHLRVTRDGSRYSRFGRSWHSVIKWTGTINKSLSACRTLAQKSISDV